MPKEWPGRLYRTLGSRRCTTEVKKHFRMTKGPVHWEDILSQCNPPDYQSMKTHSESAKEIETSPVITEHNKNPSPLTVKTTQLGIGDTAWLLSVLTALSEDPGSIPSTAHIG